MKKNITAVLAAAALVGVASAYAANPFSDVPTDSWAYQAVSQLASEGVVVGYPDGTFQGGKNITRYEMAEIIARAMAHEERANAEQKAMIDKLAVEFATELDNLGVRVDALENKVGNVKLTGDARIRYKHVIHNDSGSGNQEWTSRLRLNVTGDVNDKTKAGARLKMEAIAGQLEGTIGADDYNQDVTFDRLWLSHTFGPVNTTVGRQGVVLGDGFVMDGTIDGVVADAQLGNINVSAGYGYPISAEFTPGLRLTDAGSQNITFTYGQLSADFLKHVNLKGWYGHLVSPESYSFADGNIYGAALSYNYKKLSFGGEFTRYNKGGKFTPRMVGETASERTAWMAGVGYGNFDLAKKGTADLKVQYYHLGEYAVLIDSTSDIAALWNYKGWNVTGQYALADNLGLKLSYTFDAKPTVEGSQNYAGPLDNFYYAELNYQF